MKKLQLILTNPCAENWDEMQATQVGRYCASCTKHIVDLTSKSDQELIAFFEKKKENVCGRLLSTQLHRDLIMPPQKSNWYWLMPFALGASILSPVKSMAFNPVVFHNSNHLLSNDLLKNQPNAVKVPVVDEIKGNAIDLRTGKPLEGVKVKWKGFNNVIATTDSAGNFSITTTDEQKNNMLIFEKAGYENIQSVASTTDMVVKMKEVVIIRLGGVTSINTSNKPLYIIYSGKKSCIANDDQIGAINPEWIEKLEILKDASATAIYGAKAANGVILMGIKKEHKHKIDFKKKN